MKNSMEIDCKIPATKALGPLFTLTEIFIWDDGYSGDTGQLTSSKHIRFKYDDDDDDDDDDSKGKISSNGSLESTDIISVHNEGFTEEMSALGLPTSFQTNKHNLGGRIKRKSKVLQHSQKRPDEQVEESCKSNEEKPDSDDFQVKSNTSFSSSFPERSEHSGCDSNNGLHEHVQDSSTVDLKTVNNDAGADLQMGIDMSCVDDSSNLTNLEEDLFSDSRNVALLDQEFDDRSRYCGTCGDWSAYWDDLYMRYYFYNAQTKVSTWSPPPGMESFASGESCGSGDVATANLSSALWSDESCVIDDLCQDEITFQETITNDLMANTSSGTKKTTRRKSRRRKKSMVGSEANELYQAEESCIDITKYWCKRYLLFSRFDDGVEMDEEGWFSVTPEAIARHHASRCVGGTVIDCFTGVGGNAIQFAKTSKHVVAIDIDPNKIDYAHHNAVIYGVEDNIDFVTGDSLSVASKLKADTVFLSPPWGGPDYVKVKSYSINMLQPYDGQFLFDTFKAIAPRIIMFLPRNVNIEQLAELSLSSDPPWSLEVEKNFLNGHLKAVTAYFSRTSV